MIHQGDGKTLWLILKRGKEFRGSLDICTKFLVQYKDEKIDGAFLNFLVEYDEYNCSDYKKSKKIIDNYFETNY